MQKRQANGKHGPLLEAATRRLALASVTVGILAVTLIPARGGLLALLREGRWPEISPASMSRGLRDTNVTDVIFNILLFAPFGAFAAPVGPASPRRRAARAAIAGTLLSAAIELLQTGLPGRYPSPIDVLGNGLGAWLGAWLMVAWVDRQVGDGEARGGAP